MTRAVAFLLSGLATIGIHATFNGGTLVVHRLTATVILTGVWHWGSSSAIPMAGSTAPRNW